MPAELPRPVAGAAAGLAGGVAVLGVGIAQRPLLLVPTLPEVLSEGATFFVPFDLFAFMIDNFGAQAKLALYWCMVALVLAVCVVAGGIYARWPRPRVAVGLTIGLWLLTLFVVLPGSGLGVAGMDVYPAGPLATSAAYLASWAALAIALAVAYRLLAPKRPAPPARSDGRRATPAREAPRGTAAAPKEVSQ